jgi:hypothetical protein
MYYKTFKGEGENDNCCVKHMDSYLKSFELLNQGQRSHICLGRSNWDESIRNM